MKLKLIASIAMLLVVCGCATPQQTAGRMLASTAIGVDGCMQGWGMWVAKGKATTSEELAVMSAYEKYQLSMQIATNAYILWNNTGNSNAWYQAQDILTANQAALTALITKFQTKVTQ